MFSLIGLAERRVRRGYIVPTNTDPQIISIIGCIPLLSLFGQTKVVFTQLSSDRKYKGGKCGDCVVSGCKLHVIGQYRTGKHDF